MKLLPTLTLPKLRRPDGPPAAKRAAPVSGPAPAVQDWLPVRDVAGGVMVRADGGIVAAIRVKPVPFGLLSDREKERRITALHEVIQSFTGAVQIVVIPRPLDLDAYIVDLDRQLNDAQGVRRNLLRGYAGYVRSLAAGGQAIERRYYLLLQAEARARGARQELLARAREVARDLERAELSASVLDDTELIEMLYNFLHPARPTERAADYDGVVAPRYLGSDGNGAR